jgi:hypothetical protein
MLTIGNLRLLSEKWQQEIGAARLRCGNRRDEIERQLEQMDGSRKALALEIVMGRVTLSRGIDLDLESEALRLELGLLRLGLNELQHEQARWRTMAQSLRQLNEAIQSEMASHDQAGRDPEQVQRDVEFWGGRVQHLLKMTTERLGMWPGLQNALAELEDEAA